MFARSRPRSSCRKSSISSVLAGASLAGGDSLSSSVLGAVGGMTMAGASPVGGDSLSSSGFGAVGGMTMAGGCGRVAIFAGAGGDDKTSRLFTGCGGGIAFDSTSAEMPSRLGARFLAITRAPDIACDGGACREYREYLSKQIAWAKIATDPNVNICFFGGDMWRLRRG